MEGYLEEIREQQKASWNKFSPGWRKWDEFTMNWLRPMSHEIINRLSLQSTDNVLDVASGTGEPGLTIAGMVKQGTVLITDLAETMLDVVHENAARKNIVNYETVVCDVCELPFSDEMFDAVSCRHGFMFFPDMLMAAKEMYRVLKPGGRIATSVWAMPEKNAWINLMMGIVHRNLELPPPKPGAPGMIRCGAPGVITGLFYQAGLRNITEKEISGKVVFESKDQYWSFMTEVIAPVVTALNKADQDMKGKIKSEVDNLIEANDSGNGIALNYAALIISGGK